VVLRDGIKIREYATGTADKLRVVRDMVGEDIVAQPRSIPSLGDNTIPALLSLAHLTRNDKPQVSDVTFDVWEGEILGLYGTRGAGAGALTRVLAGYSHADSGELRLMGRRTRLPRSPREARKNGIQYLPADRKAEGLALRLSVADNIMLPNLRMFARTPLRIIVGRQGGAVITRILERLRVNLRSLSSPVDTLSGGNQQKVLLGSRLVQTARVLLLEEPTRGVDVRARADIHQALRELADTGSTIVLFSTDVDEVTSVADRVLVMRKGRIVDELAGSTRLAERAVRAATGVGDDR